MVLAAQELLIVIQVAAGMLTLWQVEQNSARAHERLEKRLLVKLRFRLDQLLVDVLQKPIRAVRERIMDRLVDRVIRVARSCC